MNYNKVTHFFVGNTDPIKIKCNTIMPSLHVLHKYLNIICKRILKNIYSH